MTARYESPDVKIELTNEEIHKRYQDTSLMIYKDYQKKSEISNYLSYGPSRRTIEYSSYGNQPVIIKRPARPGNDLPPSISKIYRKPQETCAIS